jgi:hypothetical protein
MPLSPGEKLFSNYVSAVREFEDLRRHAERVERLMEEDEKARQTEVQRLSAKQAEIEELFADPFPQVFYASIVIANCILLEQHIKGVARTVQVALSRSLSMDDLRGSLVQRFRKYCSDVINVDLELSASDWDFLIGLFLLRNCLVHGAGQIENAQLRNFTATQELPIFEDSVVMYLPNVLKLLSRTWDIIEAMYAATRRKFPSKARAYPQPGSAT